MIKRIYKLINYFLEQARNLLTKLGKTPSWKKNHQIELVDKRTSKKTPKMRQFAKW